MKNVQFVVITVAILAVAAAIFFKSKKKPCGCGEASPATEVLEGE